MHNEKVYCNISDLQRFPVGSYAIQKAERGGAHGEGQPVVIVGLILNFGTNEVMFNVRVVSGEEYSMHPSNLMTLEEYENV